MTLRLRRALTPPKPPEPVVVADPPVLSRHDIPLAMQMAEFQVLMYEELTRLQESRTYQVSANNISIQMPVFRLANSQDISHGYARQATQAAWLTYCRMRNISPTTGEPL